MRPAQSSGAATSLALIGAVVTTVANFGIAILVARAGAVFAGIFFAATAVATIVGNSTGLGTMTGLVYFLPAVLTGPNPNPRSLLALALRPVLIVSSLGAVGLFAGATPLASLIAGEAAGEIASMLRVLALVVPCWAVTVGALGATRGLGSMTPTVVVNQVLRPFGQLLLIGGVVIIDPDPSGLAIATAWAAPVILGLMVALASVWRLGGFVGHGIGPVSSAEFWRFTRPRALSTTFQIALERIDVVLVSALAGEAAAGIYGAVSRFITAGNFLIFAMGQATSSNLRRALAAADHERAQHLLAKTTGWMVLLSWPYFLVVAVKAEPLASLLNTAFGAGASALTILAVAMLANAFAGPVDLALLMLGRSRASLAATTLALAVDIGVAWVAIPRFGISGAALAWGAAVVIQNGTATILVSRIGRLRAIGPPSIIAAIGAVIAVVPVGLISADDFVGLIVTLAVAGLISVGWLIIFGSRLHLGDPRLLRRQLRGLSR